MGKKPVNIAEAEWAVLERLWDRGPSSVRELTDALYPGGGPSEYATVHKLLERLEAKEAVRRGKRAGIFVFEAAVGRDELIGQQLESLVDKMCGGSLSPLLTTLVQRKGLSAEELRSLLELVDSMDRKKKAKSK
jgi:predicted transcriptional regulator